MDRRELLQLGAATIAASTLAKSAVAQVSPAAALPGFPMDVYSKHLQWLRTPADVAKAVTDVGLNSIDLTVQAYPGHVDPTKAKTDLPAFANALKQNGVTVKAITTDIVDADSPNAEAILDAAASSGIRYYSWGGLKYNVTQPPGPQLDALKPRIQKLVRLNQKYNVKALYQPKRGTENVGSMFFDLLAVLQGFDSRFVGFRYDTAALLQVTQDNFVSHMKFGGAYIGGIALNDAVVRLELPTWNEGPFTGNPRELLAPSGGGDNAGNAGGNWDAIGGGGRPLPYRFRPVQLGTGMIDLILIGKTLKEMNFNGPAECQIEWDARGLEKGTDKLAADMVRQEAIGNIKHDRLIVNQAFETPWKTDVAKPPFMLNPNQPQQAPAPNAYLGILSNG